MMLKDINININQKIYKEIKEIKEIKKIWEKVNYL